VVASRDITERKEFEEQLRHQAFHDSLTDLPNRALFMDRLGHALARMSRSERCVAVLLLDLNNFKLVNDSLGHEVGDQLLIAVAERLKACSHPGDTVARLGGTSSPSCSRISGGRTMRPMQRSVSQRSWDRLSCWENTRCTPPPA
jgi:GGDEF domain-containing protein